MGIAFPEMSSIPPPPPPPPRRGSGFSSPPPAFPPPPVGPRPGSIPAYPPGAYPPGGLPPYAALSAYPRGVHYGAARPFAGFWQRFFQWLIDLVMVGIGAAPGLVLYFTAYSDCELVRFMGITGREEFHWVCPRGWDNGAQAGWGIAVAVLGAIAWILFNVWLTGRGASVGMRALGIRLVHADSAMAIGFWRALGWLVAHAASNAALYIGYLWAIWDDRKQTWHDKICNTVMLRSYS